MLGLLDFQTKVFGIWEYSYDFKLVFGDFGSILMISNWCLETLRVFLWFQICVWRLWEYSYDFKFVFLDFGSILMISNVCSGTLGVLDWKSLKSEEYSQSPKTQIWNHKNTPKSQKPDFENVKIQNTWKVRLNAGV